MKNQQNINLDQSQLSLLNKLLKRHLSNKTVWAYGSRVNGKAGKRSDLDLAVLNCTPSQIMNLKYALEESELLISVAVMDWENIPDSFKQNIKKQYVVLQENTNTTEKRNNDANTTTSKNIEGK